MREKIKIRRLEQRKKDEQIKMYGMTHAEYMILTDKIDRIVVMKFCEKCNELDSRIGYEDCFDCKYLLLVDL
jgi:hypothetical protein